MQGYNLIAVLSPDGSHMLMCRRRKAPYQGLLNLVGGKIEPGESDGDAAYRELQEETAITAKDMLSRSSMVEVAAAVRLPRLWALK